MLPIREAYEWKRARETPRDPVILADLLPIREAYEWKQLCVHPLQLLAELADDLLPIREAYEWKPQISSSGVLSFIGLLLASNS